MTAPLAAPATSRFQEQARWLELLSTVAIVVLVLQLVAWSVPPIAAVVSASDPVAMGEVADQLGRRAIEMTPAILYLFGVGAAQKMFARMGRGEVLTAENAAGLTSIGSSLVWGSAWALLLAPTLLGWIEGTFSGLDIRFEGPELVILVLGGALVMVGKAYAQAVALQAEVDGFV